MKHVVLLCDGMADWPIPELGDRTVLDVARTPNMDAVATSGMMGMLKTIPDGMPRGSEVGNMTVLGYDPRTDLTGRGALEALSAGIELDGGAIAFRCNLVTIESERIVDYAAGHVSTPEGRELVGALQAALGGDGVDFFPGVQYRHVLRVREPRFSTLVTCAPPHDHLGKPYAPLLPVPSSDDPAAIRTAELLASFVERSAPVLASHPVNARRVGNGQRPATHAWCWGGGKKPAIQPFHEKFGKRGAVISAVDLIFGIGIAAGLEPIHVEGATGLLDTNFEGKVQAALDALERVDFVYLHFEAADEMAHAGDIERKRQAIELFDERIVGPVLDAAARFHGGIAVAVLPDHPTPVSIKTHSDDPVPFAMCVLDGREPGRHRPARKFCERSGRDGELGLLDRGEAFMRAFLGIEKGDDGD